jgi:beta-N-acetylhexosaminidase
LAVIFGTPGTVLSDDQRSFFRDADPLGLILFKRNCETPDQVRRLCEEFREAVGRHDAPILIDHEGGTHQRMDPPVWPQFPAPAGFGTLYARDPGRALSLARLNGQAIGTLLWQHGVTVDCAPLLDVPVAGADPVIGDRAFSGDPEQVALLADAFVEGMKQSGVTPIIKHIPGHGRAMVDSHKELPTVAAPLSELDRTDFVPFRHLAAAPWAMVAHIVFPEVDPARPATVSPVVLDQLIRGRLGFQGVLISDCIYMDALGGTLPERCRAVLASGMDIALSSHGDVEEWQGIAAAARPLTEASLARLARNAVPAPTGPQLDVAAAVAEITRQLVV